MDSELQDALDHWDAKRDLDGSKINITPIVEAARKYANPDYLAAAIGHGIDLQEATDIVDLALAGRENLSTFRRQLYDDAAHTVTEDE